QPPPRPLAVLTPPSHPPSFPAPLHCPAESSLRPSPALSQSHAPLAPAARSTPGQFPDIPPGSAPSHTSAPACAIPRDSSPQNNCSAPATPPPPRSCNPFLSLLASPAAPPIFAPPCP